MNALPIVNPTIPTSIAVPSPSRREIRPAKTAPRNDPAPPIPTMTPMAAGQRPDLLAGEQQVDGPEDAPQDVSRRAGGGERAEDRRSPDHPQPVPDLARRRTPVDSVAGRAGSGRRIEPRKRADARNDTASTAMAIGALNSWIRKPLIPKAENSATEALPVRALFAATSRAGSTRVGRYDRSATLKNVVRIAARKLTDVELPDPEDPGERRRRGSTRAGRPDRGRRRS